MSQCPQPMLCCPSSFKSKLEEFVKFTIFVYVFTSRFNDSGICSPSERPEYRETERFYGGFCDLVENKPVRNQCFENQCNAAKHVCMDRITALNVYTLERCPLARPENMRPAEDR